MSINVLFFFLTQILLLKWVEWFELLLQGFFVNAAISKYFQTWSLPRMSDSAAITSLSPTSLIYWEQPLVVSVCSSLILPSWTWSNQASRHPDCSIVRQHTGSPLLSRLLLPPLRHLLHRPHASHCRRRCQGLRLRNGQDGESGRKLWPSRCGLYNIWSASKLLLNKFI